MCKCDCGNECIVKGSYLRNGHTKSCGCLQKEKTGEAAKKNALDITNKVFGELTAIYPTNERQGSSVIWLCKCSCGNKTKVAISDLTHNKIKSCGCKRKSSYGEENIEKILIDNEIKYKREIGFPNLKTINNGIPRFDFGIYDINNNLIRIIEFDGEQHYMDVCTSQWGSKFEDVQANDIIKNQYCKKNNIPLVRIPYWERENITLDMIMR